MRKRLLRSRSGFEKPESREEAIMQNILGASNVLEPSESNIEEILKSILYNTPYTKKAEFEIEKILLAIKNNGTYDGECESRDMKILFAILKGLDYTEEAESRIEELFIEWLHQRSPIKVLEGVPPLTFTSRGLPLINYLIEGNTVQSGTPTPENPVMPRSCGELDSGQYKIPILSAGQTTTVYLGEVESTRRIKKVVLDGTENFYVSGSWGKTNTAVYYTTVPNAMNLSIDVAYVMCSHYIGASRNYIYDNDIECSGMTGSNSLTFRVSRQYAGTKEDFLAYLAAQYASGTPVCVWYVLAKPTTGIVNEPLMRIGDYVDTLSYAQAGVEIPTNNGTTVIDVDTTLKPSNVYIEYK